MTFEADYKRRQLHGGDVDPPAYPHPIKCFLNLSACVNHPGLVRLWIPVQEVWVGPAACVSNKLPGTAYAFP